MSEQETEMEPMSRDEASELLHLGAIGVLQAVEGSGAGEPSLESLIGETAGAGEEAPSAGAEVLRQLAGETTADATAQASYGFDRTLAEDGKWFKFPKLGPNARVKLRKVGCKLWKELMDKARQKWGGEDGTISPATMEKIIEPIMAKSLFAGMEGVVVEVGADALPDTTESRLRLMERFTPDLRNDLFKVCNGPKNFRDNSEAILGN